MSNAEKPVTELEQNEHTDLGVTSYDQVAGMLISLLFIVGFFTSLLFIIWLTHRLVFSKTVPPIVYLEEPMGRADNPEGYAEDMAEPGMEELPELEKPELQSTLEAVTDLVSTQMGAFDAISTSATRTGKGSGLGDKRKAGPRRTRRRRYHSALGTLANQIQNERLGSLLQATRFFQN